MPHRGHPVQLLLKILTRLPLLALHELSRALFRAGYFMLRWRGLLAGANLRHVFPENAKPGRAAVLWQSYRNLADPIVEMLCGIGASPVATLIINRKWKCAKPVYA